MPTAALLYRGRGLAGGGAGGIVVSTIPCSFFLFFFVADMKERRGASFKQAVKVEEEQQGSESRNLVVGNY